MGTAQERVLGKDAKPAYLNWVMVTVGQLGKHDFHLSTKSLSKVPQNRQWRWLCAVWCSLGLDEVKRTEASKSALTGAAASWLNNWEHTHSMGKELHSHSCSELCGVFLFLQTEELGLNHGSREFISPHALESPSSESFLSNMRDLCIQHLPTLWVFT